MYKQPKYEELLFHYLSGDVSDKQRKDIFNWINESDENKAYFNEIRAQYLIMVQVSKVDLITRTDFNEVLKRINRRKIIWRGACSVAASVAILFFSFTFLFSDKPNLEYQNTSITDLINVKPGGTEAILQLSSGEEVEVNKYSDEIIKDGEDTDIEVDKKGVISYKKTDKQSKQLQYNTLIVPKGGEYTIALADGTVVKLNSHSKLKYPVEFIGSERKVFLEGEAYFDVAHNADLPFLVNINNINIKVLGTSFNVNSYDNSFVETVLVEGKVEINVNNKNKVLLPNHKAIVSDNEVFVEEVDVDPYIAWTRGDFVFYNEPLDKIMNKLSLWYNIEVIYSLDEIKDYKLTGEMQRSAEIADVLYFFEKSLDLKFEIQDKQIIISKLRI